jgi:hypothetical protein
MNIKTNWLKGFTKKYNIFRLVYYEHTTDVYGAIAREKEIKKWRREKKNTLVETMNPEWKDLSDEWECDFSSTSLVVSTSATTKGQARRNLVRT